MDAGGGSDAGRQFAGANGGGGEVEGEAGMLAEGVVEGVGVAVAVFVDEAVTTARGKH